MRLPDYPSWVQFESTIRCQGRCITCPSPLLHGSRDALMSDELLDKLIGDMAEHREHVHTIIPFVIGEPLLDPRIFDLVREISERVGYGKVLFSTNAVLLRKGRDAEIYRRLKEAYESEQIKELVFSVDGLASFEVVRKGLRREEIYRNVQDFVATIGDTSRLHVHMTVCPENLRDLAPFVDYWESRGIPVSFMASDGRVGHGLTSPLPCSRILWSNLYILSDGTYVPCCVDSTDTPKHPLANLRDNTVSEVWHGEGYQELRKMHMEIRKADSPLCGRCEVCY